MRFWLGISLLLVVLGSLAVFAQAPGQQQQPEFVKQGQQLIRFGFRKVGFLAPIRE